MSAPSQGSPLIPRKYQEEIFEQAKNENIIAALDTGSGKTLISVLLIRWIASRLAGDHKICSFIVPRVPLVEQQTSFLSSQLPLTVRGYYGAIVDPWQHDPARWKKEFEECDVMVMTPQIFLDAILHAHWSMTQVSLLVFDEAHHARKNNPYNQILREFYHTLPSHCRPKVFGMTASPIWNINNPLRSLADLEYNMLSKVLGVRENFDELAEHSPRPNETVIQYLANTTYSTYPRSLWQRLGDNGLHENPILVADKIETRYLVTLDELGPFAADVYLATYLGTILSNHAASNLHNYLVGLMGHEYIFNNLASQGTSFAESFQTPAEDMLMIKTLLNEFIAYDFQEESFVVPSEWMSLKLRTLVSELCARRHDSFQGMIFVEQRQIAVTLAWILSKISELKPWIFPGAIVGHSSGRLDSTQGMSDKKQKQSLKSFRTGVYNLLVSTSVGEEGLDFQACDLVVRFNELQHLVGYLQSRGRARRFDSTYLVMVPLDDYSRSQAKSRYEKLKYAEPAIRKLYQQRHVAKASSQSDEEEEEEDLADIAIREQFIIPTTGAVLTFGSAVSLLNHLCALIPRDRFTKAIQPVYKGDFQVAVTLPAALPIPRDKLTYEGGARSSKREAKAAAAFVACKALFDLNVFDQYFLPVRKTTGHAVKDADDRLIPDIDSENQLLDALVYDPWLPWDIPDDQTMFTVWIHPLVLPGQDLAAMALVTPGPLTMPLPEVPINQGRVYFSPSRCVELPLRLWAVLHYFTALGINWCNTPKAFGELTCFLVPLDSCGNLDLEGMESVTRTPMIRGGGIKHSDEGHLLLQICYRQGVPLLLRELREDLSPLSEPTLEDSGELVDRHSTYLEYFEWFYASKRYPISIPRESALLRVEKFTRRSTSEYQHPASKSTPKFPEEKKQTRNRSKVTRWVPLAACDVFAFSRAQIEAFVVFPQVIRRITDIYRAREAIKVLGLPCINEDLAVEALTLPSTNTSFNNQRLETLGDSVLKICVVVYVFNKFPHRHEGQLDCLRQNSVSNRALVAWAHQIRLERFLSCETSSVRKWRPTNERGELHDGRWCVQRNFGRRGLQDCMESLLGASFLSGGLDMSLETGIALQLCFGSSESWKTRYLSRPPDPVPSLFSSLQTILGYQFTSGSLLCEAFTHPSAVSDISSYQRLEFLGDALLDLVVLEYLYNKFPEATSGQLTWAKSRAVWAPSLTTVAVRRLSLHKYMIRNNVDLEQAVAKSVSEHQDMDYFHVVVEGWRYDPPKALSDVMESLCGAMFVDSHYDYDRVKPVILQIMDPLLQVLRPKLPRDPTSELYITMAKRGCQKAKFEKFCGQDAKNKLNDSLRFRVHDIVIGEPFRAGNRGLNKIRPLLAFSILKHLEKSSFSEVDDLCDCRLKKEPLKTDDIIHIDRDELDDEKEEQFAIIAALELRDAEESVDSHIDDDDDNDNDDDDEEIETLIDSMEL